MAQPAPVAWSPCSVVGGGDSSQVPAGAQCGEIEVPVDYSKSGGPVAHLAVVRFPATGQKKIGSLVVNPGGPGGESGGVDAAMDLVTSLPPEIRRRFDFVGFDPRGVGSSIPALWCNSDADNDAYRADPQVDYSPLGRRAHR